MISFNHSIASFFFNFLMMFGYFVFVIIVNSISFSTSYLTFTAYVIDSLNFNSLMSLV